MSIKNYLDDMYKFGGIQLTEAEAKVIAESGPSEELKKLQRESKAIIWNNRKPVKKPKKKKT